MMRSFVFDDSFRQSFLWQNTNYQHLSLYSENAEEMVKKIRAVAKKSKRTCIRNGAALQYVAVKDSRAVVRAAAIDALGVLAEDAPLKIFLGALCDPDWDVRAASAQALGLIGKRVPSEPLVNALIHEEDEIVADAIIRTLGALKSEIKLIRFLLQNGSSWLIRSAAAWALGEQGEHAPVQALIDALVDDPDEMVREAAARALGKVKNKLAVPALRKASQDSDEIVCEAARLALLQIRGNMLESDLAEEESSLHEASEEQSRPQDVDIGAYKEKLRSFRKEVRSRSILHVLTEAIKDLAFKFN
jgi:HEAT repeat protein